MIRPILLSLSAAVFVGCCSAELPQLESENPVVRRESLACLAEQAKSDPSVRTPLVEAALQLMESSVEPDPAVRGAAIRALAFLQAKEGIASVISSLSGEPDPLVRRAAIEFLGDLEAEPGLAVVRARFGTDEDREVRLACARELSAWSDRSPATTDALLAALNDFDSSVRHNARRSLSSIYETDQGLSPASWRRWFEQQKQAAETGLDPDEVDEGPPAPEGPELPPLDESEFLEDGDDSVTSPEEFEFPEEDEVDGPPMPEEEDGPPMPEGPEESPEPSGPPPPKGPEQGE
ncbi:MAG: HEAT repeat domain-containing protein [Planctomycetes bacterium]|nr:HEAT repeat domain-containing protein [Planctomycetota bacterium]